jgi:hypothetical protein
VDARAVGQAGVEAGALVVEDGPTNWAMLREAPSRPSSVNLASVSVTLPLASIQISFGPLIMISETESSSRYLRIGLRRPGGTPDTWTAVPCAGV